MLLESSVGDILRKKRLEVTSFYDPLETKIKQIIHYFLNMTLFRPVVLCTDHPVAFIWAAFTNIDAQVLPQIN